jgi:hypothetical protein
MNPSKGCHGGKIARVTFIDRANRVFRGFGVNRLDALHGPKAHTRFQIGTVLTSFL